MCVSGAKQFYYGSLTKGSLVLLFDSVLSSPLSSCLKHFEPSTCVGEECVAEECVAVHSNAL